MVRSIFAILVVLLCAQSVRGKEPDVASFEKSVAAVVTELTQRCKTELKRDKLRIMLGDFPCANQGMDGISAMSRIIEDKLAEALSKSPNFDVIQRDHLAKLVEEKKLQSSNLIDPSTIVKINVSGVDALVDGRFAFLNSQLSVTVRLSLLDGGKQITVTGETEAPKVLPKLDLKKEVLQPQNIANRKLNEAKAQKTVRNIKNRKINVELWTKGGRTNYKSGEMVTYQVRVDQGCHIAMFCHQIDGTTVRLFPNKYNEGTAVEKDTILSVPGDKKGFKIRIGAPFGGDIVQVIACNSAPELQSVIQKLEGFRGLELKKDIVPKASPKGTLWGEKHIMVHTYP